MIPAYTIGQEQVRLSSSRPVRLQRLPVETPVPPHDHVFTELCLLESGSVRHATPHETRVLEAGSVVVLPPGAVHAFEVAREARVTNVYYLAEWFLWDLNLLRQNEGLVPLFFAAYLFRRADAWRGYAFTLEAEEMARCRLELADIEREYERPSPSLFLIRGAFSKLLVTLARAFSRQEALQQEFNFRPEIWSALEAMDAAVQEGAGFRVEAFAHRKGLSPDGFTRIFRQATGLPPSEYFQRRRAQHAGHLLLRSNLSIGEIAVRLGYADTAHLTRSFRQWQGDSPREFRRTYGASESR